MLAALWSLFFLFSCEFSYRSTVQNQKLDNIFVFFLGFFGLGKDTCIEKMKNVSCALSVNWMHSCSWM